MEPNENQNQMPIAIDYSVKVFALKNFIALLGTYVLYAFTSFVPILWYALFIAGIIWAVVLYKEIKSDPSKATEEIEKMKVTAVMTLSPLINQTIFYYGLRKSNPELAKEYNKLGWKVIGTIALILFAYLIMILVLAYFHIKISS